MSSWNEEKSHTGFFHRSLSPSSFERLRNEHSDYFYKPKRGPSASKSNITITRPIKTLEAVTQLVELLAKGSSLSKTESSQTKLEEHKSSSQYSSLLSMDGGDLSSHTPSTFSSRSNSSISTVPEHESQIAVIEESPPPTTNRNIAPPPSPSKIIINQSNKKQLYPTPSCHVPAIGINITMAHVHLVLLELYPQNAAQSIIAFQRQLLSLIVDHEHKDWSISNVELQTRIEQEANFRLFTLTYEQFDLVLKDLQIFLHTNPSIASTLVLNIALTGEQTAEYELKISSRLNHINLNFDIIQFRAESYMIGINFFLGNHQDEFIEIFDNPMVPNSRTEQIYPYLLVHAEGLSTIFYIVHSSSKYSVLTSNNLCYKTYANLFQLLQVGHEEQISSSSSTIRRPPPVSFDLYKNHPHRGSIISPSPIPSASFAHIPSRYFPSDYSRSKTSHYIYRGWANRQLSLSDQNLTTYAVHTQTDDSFLEFSSSQTRLAMHRSLLAMFTMNLALIIKLLLQLHPSIHHCLFIGEFFNWKNKPEKMSLSFFAR